MASAIAVNSSTPGFDILNSRRLPNDPFNKTSDSSVETVALQLGHHNSCETIQTHKNGMDPISIVQEWLKALRLEKYSESFHDNGYDDLETCKQIGEADLDAIGVCDACDRQDLLSAVQQLRERGATSVYLSLDRCAPPPPPATSPDPGDSYEAGRLHLVAGSPGHAHLALLLREKLAQDGIKLSKAPYSKPDGSQGFLDALAARYAEETESGVAEVLQQLEVLRVNYINHDMQLFPMRTSTSHQQLHSPQPDNGIKSVSPSGSSKEKGDSVYSLLKGRKSHINK